MFSALFDLICTEEEECTAAACVIGGVDPETLALEPAMRAAACAIVKRLKQLPDAWCRELSYQSLLHNDE